MFLKLSLPVQLLLVLGFVVLCGGMLPFALVQYSFSLSIVIKEFLSFLLPFMVFVFICSGLMSLQKNAPLVIGVLLLCVCLSNIIVPLLSYDICAFMLPYIVDTTAVKGLAMGNDIAPLWSFHIPKLFGPEWAILFAMFVGFITTYFKMPIVVRIVEKGKKIIENIINYLFIPFLPLYVLGFLLEVQHKGFFLQLCQSYGKTYALIISLHIIFLWFIYLLASGGSLSRAWLYIKNAFPSYMTAFGTMSSSATIPVTIVCAKKNVSNVGLVQLATPILANIHLYGDAITIPVLATVTSYLFTGMIPSFLVFFKFTCYFCVTMLAASGVPGGGVLVTVPILKSILGFSDAMISIMITLHLLQDSFGTGGNVMGDGALMIIIDKILKRIGIKE